MAHMVCPAARVYMIYSVLQGASMEKPDMKACFCHYVGMLCQRNCPVKLFMLQENDIEE